MVANDRLSHAHAAMRFLAQEAQWTEAATPRALPNAIRRTPTYEISRDAFLLKVPNGLEFYYQRGRGVAVSRPPHVPESEIALFLNGSVYGAIAWINGYVPLHAAAVVHDSGVHALSGLSGMGKSTLAAALGRRGMPLMADDVLVLDLSDPARVICLPGHKKIKLWSDALSLAGARAQDRVREQLEKFYAAPPGGIHSEPLPFMHLTFLQDRAPDRASLSALKGAERFMHLSAALYRPHFCAAIVESQSAFAAIARISRAIRMTVFDRPRDRDVFDAGVDMMADAIKRRHDD